MSLIPNELDYSKISPYLHPKYRFQEIVPQNGSSTVSLSISGTQETTLEIPRNLVTNLSRSVLSFTYTMAAQGAGKYNQLWAAHNPFFQDVFLSTRSSQKPVSISNHHITDKVLNLYENSQEQMASNDLFSNGSNTSQMLRPSNSLASANYGVAGSSGTVTSSSGFVNYTEPKFFVSSTTANNTLVINVKIPLSQIKESLFVVDKNIPIIEPLLLKLVWNQEQKIGFTSAGSDETEIASVWSVLGTAGSISNLKLYLAVETNNMIASSLTKKALTEGMSFFFPYLHVYKNNLSSTSQNTSHMLDISHGRKLKKWWHAVFHNTESSISAYSHDNASDEKVLEYYTTIDTNRQTDFNIDTSADLDYMLHKDKLRGTCISSNGLFKRNWFHLEDFTDDYTGERKKKDDENFDSGLSLEQPHKFDFVGSSVANRQHNHYDIFSVQKLLVIDGNGIRVEPNS